ncbi:MAG: PCMD domain-containing protein [Prolixibacteraceae bacterium]|nr:PCMD domain-containing protein [Prolixibacteraceae bacterium]
MNNSERYPKILMILFFIFSFGIHVFSQNNLSPYVDNVGQLNYSSLDFWYARKVKESILLSGNTIELFGVGKVDSKSDFYDTTLNDKKSPWATTNIYSKMVLDIGNTRVFPEKRENGYCCRLETSIRKDNIAGLKVEVLIAGTLFVGDLIEPIKSLKDPLKNVNQGVLFTRKPKAVKFDYKYKVGNQRVKAIYSTDPAEGNDKSEFCLILQKRWEDKNGNVFATRIGGARQFFIGTVKEWINDSTFPIYYGDITHLKEYDAKTMGLIPGSGEVFVKNSQGKMVSLVETGWGKPNDVPTHLIFYFTSSYQGILYTGSTETVFWVDNIEFVY